MAWFNRSSMRNVTLKSLGKVCSVIRIDLRVVTTTRYGNVCQPAIHEFFTRVFGVYVNQHAIRSLSLTAVARHGIAIVEMRILFDVERDGPPRVEA